MSVIANLDINLRGETANLDGALGKAEGGVAKFAESVGKTGANLSGALSFLTGAGVSKIADSLDSSGSQITSWAAGIGGVIGALFGGVGAPIGAAIGTAFGAAVDSVKGSLTTAYEEIKALAQPLIDTVSEAFQAVADALLTFFKPIYRFVKEMFDGTFFLIGEVFSVIAEAIKPVWEWVQRLLTKWTELSDQWPNGGEVAIKAFKRVGQAVGYVIDAFRFLAGAASRAAGKIVEVLGPPVLAVLRDVAHALSRVFPDSFGGTFFENISKEFDKMSAKADGVGKKMQAWGKVQMSSFGQTSKTIGAWFDGVLERFRNRKPKEALGEDVQSKGTTAVERGSLAAYKLITGTQGDKMYKVANEQLVELRKLVDEARKKKPGTGLGKGKL